MKARIALLLIASAIISAPPCQAAEIPFTGRTKGLIRELLTKLDSTEIYVARKEREIETVKSRLSGNSDSELYELYYEIADKYTKYMADSAMAYLNKATLLARNNGWNFRAAKAEIDLANMLSVAGLYFESNEILQSIPRSVLTGSNLSSYYNANCSLYHNLYSGIGEPDYFREKYRASYNMYRDSLLSSVAPDSDTYLRNIEKKEARAGNCELARRYNAVRYARIKDRKSYENATCIYDRFTISYLYEHNLTGEAVDDLLESAIIEVENCNQDIASLLRVETFLIQMGEVDAAKKISDYYYSTLLKFGSRKRQLDGLEKTIEINNRSLEQLLHKNREIKIAFISITILVAILFFLLIVINRIRRNVTGLNKELQRSNEISKGYIGVIFQLYSSYIKRLDTLRLKIHTTLKKGNLDKALELTSQSNSTNLEEMKELHHNFDAVFLDIFPNYIEIVNSCLKPEFRIIQKRPEYLTTELRILALTKLGIDDSTKIAEMLHCSVKTIYNLRSGFKSRLAIPEKDFKKIISDM